MAKLMLPIFIILALSFTYAATMTTIRSLGALELIVITLFSGASSFPSVSLNNTNSLVQVDSSIVDDKAFKEPMHGEQEEVLENWSPPSFQSPGELGEYFEGDIILPEDLSRNGIIDESYRWPNGVIPYEIPENYPSSAISNLTAAMKLFEKYTCIRFREKLSSDEGYISIYDEKKRWCSAPIGYRPNKQQVNLAPWCLRAIRIPLHELMHVIGFYHEHSRPDRDQYVTVFEENIKKDYLINYEKLDSTKVSGFGVPYDYKSVLHYSGSETFPKNGKPKMIIKDNIKAGNSKGLSRGDIMKINNMYGCPEKNSFVPEDKIYSS